MYKLSQKNFENPIKGKCKWYKEITQGQFNKIYSVHSKKQYFGGVSSWGTVINNSCIVFEINGHSRIQIEQFSYNNSGVNAKSFLVVK